MSRDLRSPSGRETPVDRKDAGPRCKDLLTGDEHPDGLPRRGEVRLRLVELERDAGPVSVEVLAVPQGPGLVHPVHPEMAALGVDPDLERGGARRGPDERPGNPPS